MAKMNENFLYLQEDYVFSRIDKEVSSFLAGKRDGRTLLYLGTGDIVYPLVESVSDGFRQGITEMQRDVIGYGPTEGYPFLRDKIIEVEYSQQQGLQSDEIFISDGIARDICDIQNLFHLQARFGIVMPTYPAYAQAILLGGREVVPISCVEEHDFMPWPPHQNELDAVYLCSPNNPTGIALTREVLHCWVDWARRSQTILLFDSAYYKFITSQDCPRTIYEIEGAKEVAIEFRSFSKSFGFSGIRLGYTVIPKLLKIFHAGGYQEINRLWRKRQDIVTNGISYPVQRGGESALLNSKDVERLVQLYSCCAFQLKNALQNMGFICYGGIDSPYVWWKVPKQDKNSWNFFYFLLQSLQIVVVPGKGFGEEGEGFVRLSGFLRRELVHLAIERLQELPMNYCSHGV